MYPVWTMIRETVKNARIRVGLVTALGEDRAHLARAYPRCVSEDRKDLELPMSVMRTTAFELATQTGSLAIPQARQQSCYQWLGAAVALDMPIAHHWSGPEQKMPEEIANQLKGQIFVGGLTVQYRGEQHVIVDIVNRHEPSRLLAVGSVLEGPFDHLDLALVEAHYIDRMHDLKL